MKKYLSFFRWDYNIARLQQLESSPSLHGDLWNFLFLEHFIRQMRLPFQ